MIITDMSETVSTRGVVRLNHLGLIRARGADAARFLNAQLTNELLTLRAGLARWAGFCSAKGRLQANFLVWRSGPEEYLLACTAGLLEATLKRLSMFVLRLQCKLDDAGRAYALHGVLGEDARPWVEPLEPFATASRGAATVLRLPDVEGVLRGLLVVPPDERVDGTALDLESWRWFEVRSGLPWIEPATVDRFVPQMLNQELIGAVDFRKGCYPGQEVVARSQYRGTIKRRMFLFETDATAHAGDEVYWSEDPTQPAGQVANAARGPGGTTSALVEVKLAALELGEMHLLQAGGAPLRRVPLPYSVPVGEAA
jgi:folate-binding protein YgfZ